MDFHGLAGLQLEGGRIIIITIIIIIILKVFYFWATFQLIFKFVNILSLMVRCTLSPTYIVPLLTPQIVPKPFLHLLSLLSLNLLPKSGIPQLLDFLSWLFSQEQLVGDELVEEFGGEVLAEHKQEDIDGLVEAADIADEVENFGGAASHYCFELVLS